MDEYRAILMNRDSLDVFYDVARSVDTSKIIVVSDPPFNVKYHYREYKDDMDENEYYDMLDYIFSSYPSVVIHYPECLYKLSYRIGKFPEKVISWVYSSNTARQHRDIAFFGIKPKMEQVRQPYKNLNDKRIQKRIKEGKTGAKLYDWWNINQAKNVNKDKTAHPCQMPIEVMENIIGILPHDSIIIDPFMGSGTTGVAVNNMNLKQGTNRTFIGIEKDNLYYEIAKNRICNKGEK